MIICRKWSGQTLFPPGERCGRLAPPPQTTFPHEPIRLYTSTIRCGLMHQVKAVFRVGTMDMERGVNRVITHKSPDGKGYQPRSQVRPARIKGQRRSLRPRPPLSNATQRGEPGCQKLTFYPASRTEKQHTPAPRKHGPRDMGPQGFRRSSSPSAEKNRPSCQGAQKCRPDLRARLPSAKVRTRQRMRRCAAQHQRTRQPHSSIGKK